MIFVLLFEVTVVVGVDGWLFVVFFVLVFVWGCWWVFGVARGDVEIFVAVYEFIAFYLIV